MRDRRFRVYIGWGGRNSGTFTVGRSTVAPGNLVTNPSFEVDATGHIASAGNTITRALAATEGIVAKRGVAVGKAVTNGVGSGLDVWSLNLPAADTYTCSMWVWVPSSYDGTGLQLTSANFAGVVTIRADSADMSKRDQWQLLVCIVTVAAGDLSGDFRISRLGPIAPTAGRFVYTDYWRVERTASYKVYDTIGYPFTPRFEGVYDLVSDPGRFSAVEFALTRGRTERWAPIQAGELSLVLHDSGDGRYNPNNPASPLYGLLLPMVPVKLTAILEDGATEEDLFHGWLDEASSNPDVGTQRATFNFKDLLMWLDGDNPVIASTGSIYVGEALGLILDWFGFTNPATRDLAPGSLLPDFSADGSASGLQLAGQLLQVDLGVFFISRTGVATYLDRYEYSRRDSAGVFSAASMQVPGVARSNIRNKITVSFDTGNAETTVTQAFEDTPSRRRYGPRAWEAVTSRYFGSDQNAANFAAYKLAQGRSPISTFWRFVMSEGPAGYFDSVARTDLINRITVQAPNNKDFHIEQIVHRGNAGELFKSEWVLSERQAEQAFIVGRSKVAPSISAAGYDRVVY